MSVLMDANSVPTPDEIYKSFEQSEALKQSRSRTLPVRLQPIVNYILCEMRKDANVVNVTYPSNITIEIGSPMDPYEIRTYTDMCKECAFPESIQYLNQVLSPWNVSYCDRRKIVELSSRIAKE
jgi:hypothetical protein